MSTELAKAPEPKSIIKASDRGLVLQTLDDMWRAATAFHKSGLFIKTHDTVEKTFVAMQCGAEVGLAPVQALMSIAVINGRPTIWGDAVPGLCWASGVCENIEEKIEGTGDSRTATCIAKRKGAATAVTGRFSMADAKRAGLLGKGTWSSYPDRMLQMRARGFALRDGFADVLKGLQVREEVLDYSDATLDATPAAKRLTAIPDELPEESSDQLAREHDEGHALRQRIFQVNSATEATELLADIADTFERGEITREESDELAEMLRKEMT